MTVHTSTRAPVDRRLSVAPMMDWTDRHCRFMHRLLAPGALLYTEMVVAEALLRGPRERLLAFDATERPLAIQLGGSEPQALGAAAALAFEAGFDEINLNVGCPSDRVQAGRFGACLMLEPERVAACVAAMVEAVPIPVTVKTRTGVDERDDYATLARLVAAVGDAGCAAIIVHARKAWLKGLSPAQNRSVPPLDYTRVYRLKRDFPALPVVLNGGVGEVAPALDYLQQVDGVMLGRRAYEHPWSLREFQRVILGGPVIESREELLQALQPYAVRQGRQGVRLWSIARHLLGLYRGEPGGRRWRDWLSRACRDPHAAPAVLLESLRVFHERPRELEGPGGEGVTRAAAG